MRNTVALLTVLTAACLFLSGVSFGQTSPNKIRPTITPDGNPVRSTPAFAEVVLRKTEIESELEALLIDYTDDFPKVSELKYELSLVNGEAERLLAVKPVEAGKLTLALGKLIIKKVSLEAALWELSKTYKDEHPEIKRAKRRVEIYQSAIKEILGR